MTTGRGLLLLLLFRLLNLPALLECRHDHEGLCLLHTLDARDVVDYELLEGRVVREPGLGDDVRVTRDEEHILDVAEFRYLLRHHVRALGVYLEVHQSRDLVLSVVRRYDLLVLLLVLLFHSSAPCWPASTCGAHTRRCRG